MKVSVFCAAALLASSAWATTYTYTSPNYTNFTNCTAGPCANYTASMSVSGWFRTASPLAPNLAFTDITPLVTAYYFTDGINTYSNADPNARIGDFTVQTDGSGQITSAFIYLERWQTGSSPHTTADRLAVTLLVPVGNVAANDVACTAVGASPVSGVSDACTSPQVDPSTSEGANAVAGTWSTAAATVPTLGEPEMAALAVLLVLCAWYTLRRAQDAAGKA